MKMKQVSEEVFFPENPIVKVGSQELAELNTRSQQSPRQRVRLCTHQSTEDLLHEMFIAKTRDTYVRPHKNKKEAKSFFIVDGQLDVIVFDEVGQIVDVVHMGDYVSGKLFYLRLPEPGFHMLIIKSNTIVFKETTHGPFTATDTTYAPWAPEEGDLSEVAKFMARLALEIDCFENQSQEKTD